MTAPANEIDALKETIEKLEGRRNKLISQRDNEAGDARIDTISKEIIAISKEITSINNRITATLTAQQQQGKFPLSFSFFPR